MNDPRYSFDYLLSLKIKEMEARKDVPKFVKTMGRIARFASVNAGFKNALNQVLQTTKIGPSLPQETPAGYSTPQNVAEAKYRYDYLYPDYNLEYVFRSAGDYKGDQSSNVYVRVPWDPEKLIPVDPEYRQTLGQSGVIDFKKIRDSYDPNTGQYGYWPDYTEYDWDYANKMALERIARERSEAEKNPPPVIPMPLPPPEEDPSPPKVPLQREYFLDGRKVDFRTWWQATNYGQQSTVEYEDYLRIVGDYDALKRLGKFSVTTPVKPDYTWLSDPPKYKDIWISGEIPLDPTFADTPDNWAYRKTYGALISERYYGMRRGWKVYRIPNFQNNTLWDQFIGNNWDYYVYEDTKQRTTKGEPLLIRKKIDIGQIWAWFALDVLAIIFDWLIWPALLIFVGGKFPGFDWNFLYPLMRDLVYDQMSFDTLMQTATGLFSLMQNYFLPNVPFYGQIDIIIEMMFKIILLMTGDKGFDLEDNFADPSAWWGRHRVEGAWDILPLDIILAILKPDQWLKKSQGYRRLSGQAFTKDLMDDLKITDKIDDVMGAINKSKNQFAKFKYIMKMNLDNIVNGGYTRL